MRQTQRERGCRRAERDRQTDRQTERQTDRQTIRQTDHQTDRQTDRDRDRQRQKEEGKWGGEGDEYSQSLPYQKKKPQPGPKVHYGKSQGNTSAISRSKNLQKRGKRPITLQD